jgi:glutaredoxin
VLNRRLPALLDREKEEDETVSIKLHRCRFTFVHSDISQCYRVQKALDDQGIDYGVVKSPYLPRSRRKDVERLSGQRLLPVIEFDDGSVYREESADMAATIMSGQLGAKRGAATP